MMVKRNVPQRVLEIVPEAKIYEELLEKESQIDHLIARQKFSMIEELRKGQSLRTNCDLELSVTTHVRKISNNNEGGFFLNQPNCSMLMPIMQSEHNATVYWEVNIDGKILDNGNGSISKEPMSKKFGNFVKTVIVECDKNVYGDRCVLFEWRKESRQDIEGNRAFRLGLPCDVNLTVLIELNHNPPKFKLDSRLSKLLGIEICTKTLFISSIWQYITSNSLQDSADHKMIKLDSHLSDLLGVPEVPITEIIQSFNKFMKKLDPIQITHRIDSSQISKVINDNETLTSATTKLVEVGVENTYADDIKSFLVSIKQPGELEKYDSELLKVIESLRLSSRMQQFFEEFANSPVQFFRDWLMAQKNDYKIMSDTIDGPDGLDPSNPASSSENNLFKEQLLNDSTYFTKPWISEAVTRYYGDLVIAQQNELYAKKQQQQKQK